MGRVKQSVSKGLCLALAVMFTVACTQPETGNSPAPASRLINKFADTSQPPPNAFQVTMSTGAPVILRYERAMSGEAHVYNGRMSQKQLAAIIRKLNQRPDVEYAEADRKASY
jgi:hypothetical protein